MDQAQGDGRPMDFDRTGKDKMTIPERIVLSAGYDGDDNEETSAGPFVHSSAFDETPIVNANEVLGGMHTPPSVLTIDHSATMFRNSPNWHTEGDGADDDQTKTYNKYRNGQRSMGQNGDDEDDEEEVGGDHLIGLGGRQERSVVIAGREDYTNHYLPVDDPRLMQQWYTSMQRRMTILENEQEHQSRVSNVWKYFLLTLTIINPIVIHYFFGRRR